eukprot:Nitzschia sp. Nitz4//scaffold422_size12231//2454//3710//NITZ4_008995-RA/size12231-processed-gene-0.2-mRNA-1//1//CDS//3329551572//1464//frame0
MRQARVNRSAKSLLLRLTQRPKILLGLILCLSLLQQYVLLSSGTPNDDTAGHLSIVHSRTNFSNSGIPVDPKQFKSTSSLALVRGPVFYNLFVPPGNLTYTQQIVQEQLDQIAISDKNSTLLITLIGSEAGLRSQVRTYVLTHCPSKLYPDACQIRQEVEEGEEGLTLQALWEYCQVSPLPSNDSDMLVTYIHDKGSYHPTDTNDMARRMATKSALECRNELIHAKNPKMCNTCASVFHVFPQYLVNANMWTARCSYIRRLIEPTDYPSRVQDMFDQTLNHSHRQNLHPNVCLKPPQQAPNLWGIGRYALEKWAFSHPFLKPCNVLSIPEGSDELFQDKPNWKPRLRKAPHTNAKTLGITGGPYKSSWARLTGRLFEWNYLYGNVPPANSWVWKFYKGYENGTEGFYRSCLQKQHSGP